MNITYTQYGDYYLPDLVMPEQPNVLLGKYAHMRKNYLKQHRRVLYTILLTSGKLTEHLAEIDKTAKEQVDRIVQHFAEADGVNEDLKERDQMRWTGLVNNYIHTAEEIVLKELIYD